MIKFDLPIIHIGFLINLNLPQNPIYFERHPADHNRIIYSTPKNTTKHISIQKSVSFAKLLYISIVESTLNIRQTRTSINLKIKNFNKLIYLYKKFKKIFNICNVNRSSLIYILCASVVKLHISLSRKQSLIMSTGFSYSIYSNCFHFSRQTDLRLCAIFILSAPQFSFISIFPHSPHNLNRNFFILLNNNCDVNLSEYREENKYKSINSFSTSMQYGWEKTEVDRSKERKKKSSRG